MLALPNILFIVKVGFSTHFWCTHSLLSDICFWTGAVHIQSIWMVSFYFLGAPQIITGWIKTGHCMKLVVTLCGIF